MPTFGPYELLRRLGTGGMGEVFLARLCRQDRFEKLLVIKRILPQLSSEEGFREMFRREARLAALLSHQNIVQIFDYGEVEGESFIAMEYVEGIDAATLAARAGRLAPPVVLQILEQAARGLDYAHRKADADGAPLGLVHRDATPRNLLLSCEGEVKWIDFGLAHALRQDGTARVAGTVPYMSPEQASGRPLDARSDLFGLGVTAYHLLAGALPFEDCGNDLEARVRAVVEGELVPLSDHGLPPALDLLAVRALAPDPQDRFQSAREMLAAIEAVARELGSTTPHELAELVRAHRRASESALPTAQPERTLVGDEPVAPREAEPVAARETEPVAAREAEPVSAAVLALAEPTAVPEPERALEHTPAALRPWHLALAAVALVGALGAWAALASSASREDAGAIEAARAQPGPHWELVITSQPAGATVIVDGEVVGQTPYLARELAPREAVLELRVEAPRHVPLREELTLGAQGGRITRDFVLVPRNATLVLEVAPSGAQVRINNAVVDASAPIEVAPGPLVLVASAPGHRTWTATLEVEAAAELRQVVELEAEPADLRIEVLPLDAQVVVRALGGAQEEPVARCTGPCIAADLATGRYVIEVERAGHSPVRQEVELAPGEQRSVQVRCEARPNPASTPPLRLRARGGAFKVGRSKRESLGLDAGTFEFSGAGITVVGRLERAPRGATLTLQSKPYARFTIDGRAHDKPNVSFLPLGSGRHEIRLEGESGVGFDLVVP